MSSIDLLDAGPLGLACCHLAQRSAGEFRSWLDAREASGIAIRIPAIADYEVSRELIRARATAKLGRLLKLRQRYQLIDITREALEAAAIFWAELRQTGRPTAGLESLDADAILAGMAATIGRSGDSVVVITTNVKHLSRFPGVEARLWESIG